MIENRKRAAEHSRSERHSARRAGRGEVLLEIVLRELLYEAIQWIVGHMREVRRVREARARRRQAARAARSGITDCEVQRSLIEQVVIRLRLVVAAVVILRRER